MRPPRRPTGTRSPVKMSGQQQCETLRRDSSSAETEFDCTTRCVRVIHCPNLMQIFSDRSKDSVKSRPAKPVRRKTLQHARSNRRHPRPRTNQPHRTNVSYHVDPPAHRPATKTPCSRTLGPQEEEVGVSFVTVRRNGGATPHAWAQTAAYPDDPPSREHTRCRHARLHSHTLCFAPLFSAVCTCVCV